MSPQRYPLIGILGGTFNPIHFGHLRMAQELVDRVGLSEVRFIPSATPPHKSTPSVPAAQRAEMVHLAIEDNPVFKLDLLELTRSGPSYTIDTLEHLYHLHPTTSWCLMLGSDAFGYLNTWHRWQALLEYCHIILVKRPATLETKALCPEMAQCLARHTTTTIQHLSTQRNGLIFTQAITALDISSSQIRGLIAHKHSVQYLTPNCIVAYIEAHKLYC